ncbi:PREDICTED: uncharacterized protein LOC106115563 [Papilio xuthus]|uniref:Uncharacterized protein LOC106115563 n=1 Tax=Papilio xuthus TaxID=66420 RepID=A0AAJ7E605_PAPXU|nr:PREDICTED: uncharacterized protein LOC106115563 [Papilio xuthus]
MWANESILYKLLMPSNFSAFENLAKSAAVIALNNFEWRFTTFVFYNMTILYGIDYFVKKYKKTLILSNGHFYPRFAENIHQYILFDTNLTNIAQMLKWMDKRRFDNTGKYIIICLSNNDCDEAEAVNIFWNYKIVNVVLLKTGQSTNETDVFSYFNEKYDCKSVRPIKLDNWHSCLFINDEKCIEMFPLKLRNLQSCPITVSTFKQKPYMTITNGVPSGADGDLLILIAEKLNASLVLRTPHRGFGWGKLEDDGTWSGSLADVYYNLANFSMTSASITLSRFSQFQMSMDYNTVSVVWVTHPSDLESPSLKLMRPFNFEVRIALAVSFIVIVILAIFVKSKCSECVFRATKTIRPRRSLVFYSWELCMGLPSTKLPKNSAFLYVVLFWIWYCFLVRTIYTVFLIKALKTNKYRSDLLTIEDAIAANYEIGGGPALKDYYIDEPTIYNRWINLESNEIFPTMLNISNGQKFVVGVNTETFKLFQRNLSVDLHKLPQKVISSPTVIFFNKFSPLVAPMNTILTQLIEAGFTSKLYKNYTKSKYTSRSSGKKKAINLVHYTGCYAILIGGWIMSLIFFILELIVGRSRSSS